MGKIGWRPQCIVVAVTGVRVMAMARGGVAKVRLSEMHGSFEHLGEDKLMGYFMLVFTWKDQ